MFCFVIVLIAFILQSYYMFYPFVYARHFIRSLNQSKPSCMPWPVNAEHGNIDHCLSFKDVKDSNDDISAGLVAMSCAFFLVNLSFNYIPTYLSILFVCPY